MYICIYVYMYICIYVYIRCAQLHEIPSRHWFTLSVVMYNIIHMLKKQWN